MLIRWEMNETRTGPLNDLGTDYGYYYAVPLYTCGQPALNGGGKMLLCEAAHEFEFANSFVWIKKSKVLPSIGFHIAELFYIL